ncbi:hypothetical protein M2651_04095 [Clostridium sp. SYSU_GA19001]|uniref:hypothetical protein n=1 Tax=Clostridium caldaquaticum TaxID=2940653 RepID=UPI00207727AD|nr:hypothetical protein [Clostridium caldaquaticum]MCM8710207.1 hypothetical protein [Clostridium caldaquaticum]
MSEGALEIGKCIFGYEKKEVEKYVDKLKNTQYEKLKKLKNKILHVKMENVKLKKEIEELKSYLEEQMKNEELINFALLKAEDTITVINKFIMSEAEKIKAVYEQEEVIFNNKIEEFNHTIKNTQEQLGSLLNDILDSSENFNEKVKRFIDAKDSYKGILNEINRTEETKPLELKQNIEKKEIIKPKERESMFSLSIDDAEDFAESEITKTEENTENKEDCSIEPKLIAEDFNNIRYKYLVGKIAGEDLFDKNNNVIISKNSIITADVVNKAENEGKLAQLIVNMILPDVKNS